MGTYEITFEWPSGDWTWTVFYASDFHELLEFAISQCPSGARVHHFFLYPILG